MTNFASRIKRPVLFVTEFTIVLLGLILSVTLAAIAEPLVPLALIVFVSGLLLTFLALFFVRRKSHEWKLNYNISKFEKRRIERKLSPVRFKLKESLKPSLLLAPSAIAAFVLLFFPIASHLAYPGSNHVPWLRHSYTMELRRPSRARMGIRFDHCFCRHKLLWAIWNDSFLA